MASEKQTYATQTHVLTGISTCPAQKKLPEECK